MQINIAELIKSIDNELDIRYENIIIWPFTQIDRIGHCILEPWIMDHLFQNQEGKKYVLLPSHEINSPCNKILLDYMFLDWEKIYTGNRSIFSLAQSGFNKVIGFNGKKYIFIDGAGLYENFYHYLKSGKKRKFKLFENKKIENFYNQYKLDGGKKLYVIHNREAGYLPQLNYHSYRDSNVHNLELSIDYLLESGFNVVRIGDSSMTPLNICHPNLIDLSNKNNQGLELDLVYNCEGYIGSSSGPELLTLLFNKRKLTHNGVAVNYLDDNMHILYKGYFDLNSKKYLGYKELNLNAKFCKTEDFIKNNILLVENTPQQILASVIDFVSYDDNCIYHKVNEEIDSDLKQQGYFYTPSTLLNFNISRYNYFNNYSK